MTMRVTGLTSGLDTESIISALVSAYETKTQKYTKAQTKLTWTQEAWKSLNTKVYSLYTNVSNLRFSSAYTTKKATVSDATKATVTASGSAVNGTQRLQINSVAESGYMTGAKITPVSENGREATDTKLSELGYTGGETSFDVKLGDGTTKTIEVSKTTKISDIVSALGEAGLNANFDTTQNRFYVSSKTSGSASDFTFVPSGKSKNSDGATVDSSDAFDALYALGLTTLSGDGETGKSAGDVRISSTATDTSGHTATASTTVSFSGYAPKNKAEADAQNALIDALKAAKTSIISYDGNGDQTYTLEGYKFVDGEIYAADEDGNATGDAIASYADAAFSVKDANGNDQTSAYSPTNFSSWGRSTVTAGTAASYNKATKIDGCDASIILNDVEYTSTSNNFSINGLSITAQAKTDGEITITTATDTQAIYDKIKDFLTEYNGVINEMTELYNADSSYGYDPLTDDEKDAMSDTEIEKWETKIKDSLLRNDSTLNSIMMSMINAMSSSYTINGQKYTLSTFGIATLGYLNAAENENYAYHIDGDSDDDNTSSNTDKLMTAITSDPDTVIDFMKQLTSGLYTAIGNKMKSTTLSSAYTIYNDKEMNSQYSEYSETISKWEDKLSDKEDYYYNKFASMESALTTLQSQSSAVTGLFSS